MTREQSKAIVWGLITPGLLDIAIFAGSRNLKHIGLLRRVFLLERPGD